MAKESIGGAVQHVSQAPDKVSFLVAKHFNRIPWFSEKLNAGLG